MMEKVPTSAWLATLLLVMAGGGCARATRDAPVTASRPTVREAPAAVATAADATDRAPPSSTRDACALLRAAEPCLPHPGGAWGVTERVSPKEPGPLLELTHLADDGTRVAAAFEPTWNAEIQLTKDDAPNGHGSGVFRAKSAYDFDHDGVPEIWIEVITQTDDVQLRGDALFTLRAGQIVPYPPAGTFSQFELRDVDHDGIPDLVYREQLGGGYEVGCGVPAQVTYSLPLVAHAKKDGTFSFDDEEARKGARLACPTPPAQVERIKTLNEVFCARLWGVSTKRLAHLEREKERCFRANVAHAPPQGCEPTGRRACPDEYDLSALASRVPRLTLSE